MVPAISRKPRILGNAGTAMRPLAAALAVLAATQGGRFELRGGDRMHERPIGDLVDALRQLGCSIDYLGIEGFPPLRLSASARPLNLGKPIRVRGDVSSQFLLPDAGAATGGGSSRCRDRVDGELISDRTSNTLNLVGRFGVAVARHGAAFRDPAGAEYVARTVRVDGDHSRPLTYPAAGGAASERCASMA